MKTKDEVIEGFMERHCALLMDANMPAYNTIRSQLGGIWENGYKTGWNDLDATNTKHYNDGYSHGKDAAYQELSGWTPRESKDMINEAYQRGLTDAWKAAKKIVCAEGGFTYQELLEIFGEGSPEDIWEDVLKYNTAQEAIEKIKAWEEKEAKKEKLKVGDEVRGFNGETYVIYDIKGDSARATNFTICSNCFNVNDTGYKTGRHFPQVEQLLKEMGEE